MAGLGRENCATLAAVRNSGEPADANTMAQDGENEDVLMVDTSPMYDGQGLQTTTSQGWEGEDDAWEDVLEDESISFVIRNIVDAQ